MIRRIIGMLFLLGIIGGLVWYYGFRPAGDVVITGLVTTDDVIVSSQVVGRIKELRVREGSLVKKGDLVATIESDEWEKDMAYFEQARVQAQHAVEEAEAAYRFLNSQAESQIEQANANLAAADAQIAQAKADAESARLTFTHEQEAFKRGAESQQQFDVTRMAYESQKARLDAVSRQRDAASAALNIAKATLEQVAQRQAAVEMSKAQLLAATAQKEKAGVQLAYTEIRSPVNGIVDKRIAMQGEVVNPANPIVTLIDQDNLWIRADVEESLVERMKIDDELPVRLPSGAIKTGKVFYRSVDAEYATQRDVSRAKRDVKTFEVRLKCDNADRALAVGMTAYVTLPAAELPHKSAETEK